MGKLLREKPERCLSFFRLPLPFLSYLASSYLDRRTVDKDVEVDIVRTPGNVEADKHWKQGEGL